MKKTPLFAAILFSWLSALVVVPAETGATDESSPDAAVPLSTSTERTTQADDKLPEPKAPKAHEQPAELQPASRLVGSSPSYAADSELSRFFREHPVIFELGTRSLYIDLITDKKGEPFDGSFIGSINELKADQNYLPFHPYVQALVPLEKVRLGLGLTYDELKVATEDGGGGDGDVEMKAWTVYAIVVWPLEESALTPYGEIGYARYMNTFNADPAWYDNGRRNFELSDSAGLHLAIGADYVFSENWSANLYIRYVDVEVDGEYVFRGDDRPPEPFTFPMEHMAYGLGVKYTF